MKLKSIAIVSALASLQGCIYIPGSVIGAVSDAATGHEGEHCVGVSAKVGQRITLPDGNVAEIKSISGASVRCKNPEMPSRALAVVVPPTRTYTGKLNLALPEGWETRKLTNVQQDSGVVVFAGEKVNDIWITLNSSPQTTPKFQLADMRKYKERVVKGLVAPQSSEIMQLEYKGMTGYQFVVSGKSAAPNALDLTYVYTVVPLDQEVATIRAWSKTESYEKVKDELNAVSLSLVGYEK